MTAMRGTINTTVELVALVNGKQILHSQQQIMKMLLAAYRYTKHLQENTRKLIKLFYLYMTAICITAVQFMQKYKFTRRITFVFCFWRMITVCPGPVSISNKTSYRKIWWSLEATSLAIWIIAPLWNLTGTYEAVISHNAWMRYKYSIAKFNRS